MAVKEDAQLQRRHGNKRVSFPFIACFPAFIGWFRLGPTVWPLPFLRTPPRCSLGSICQRPGSDNRARPDQMASHQRFHGAADVSALVGSDPVWQPGAQQHHRSLSWKRRRQNLASGSG